MSEALDSSHTSTPNYRYLWAKSNPRHPLWKHLLDSAAVSLALTPPLADLGWTPSMIAFIVGLHDIGKADSYFQHQQFSEELIIQGYPKTADARCRHERISAEFSKQELTTLGFDPFLVDAIALVIVAHHGHWIENARCVSKEYATAQKQLCQMLQSVLQLEKISCKPLPNLSNFGMRLAGHIVLCDWIASNEAFFTDVRLKEIEEPSDYFIEAEKVAREWIGKLSLQRDRQSGKPMCIIQNPRPIQQVLLDEDIPPGLVIIEAPMGEGKTEAAWILAEKWRDTGYHGMYMALPTMATSDSLYFRYQQDYLNQLGYEKEAKLVHGMAWLRDTQEPEKPLSIGEPDDEDDRSLATAWFRPTRRAMLAAHGVGTVDQAMLAGMNVKFGFLRLYGLVDKVLVIDEVHAYDAYMSAIICRLLNWCACLKIPVILLSATLSAKQRSAMIEAYGAKDDPGPSAPYPLITVAESGKSSTLFAVSASSTRTLRIETHPGLLGDAKRTAAKAVELVKHDGCCCIILNTVKQAQAVYKALDLPKDQKLLFHARFTAIDREKITKKVLNLFGKDTSTRPTKFVLVATQVVEQSLDVDFDCMISEIAPIDLLLQRSGRMHRHRKRDFDPILHVLQPEDESSFGGTAFVYADKPLLRTVAILDHWRVVHLPDDFRTLIECCYGSDEWEQEAIAWEVIHNADREWEDDAQVLFQQGKQFALCEPSTRYFRPVNNDPTGDDSDDGNGWRAKTRLGANEYTAVLIKETELQELADGELPMRRVRVLYRRSLKLPRYMPIFCPSQGYSSAVEAKGRLRGLILLPISDNKIWQGLDEKQRLYQVTYDKQLGLLAGRVK